MRSIVADQLLRARVAELASCRNARQHTQHRRPCCPEPNRPARSAARPRQSLPLNAYCGPYPRSVTPPLNQPGLVWPLQELRPLARNAESVACQTLGRPPSSRTRSAAGAGQRSTRVIVAGIPAVVAFRLTYSSPARKGQGSARPSWTSRPPSPSQASGSRDVDRSGESRAVDLVS